MTGRDRKVIGAVLTVGVLGLFWMLALNPKRKEAGKLGQDVAAQRERLDAARAEVTASRAAQQRFATDYATVARLGKAVPEDDDVPSLVYQLDSAAGATGVDFRKFTLKQTSGTSTPPSGAASGGSGGGSGTGSPGGSSSGGPSGSGGASGPSGSGSSGASGSGSGSSGPSGSGSSGAAGSAPATEAAAATLPPGSTIGSAGFPTMPFSFVFEGSFLRLSAFLRKLDRFVVQRNDALSVAGRLLTIDGLNLEAGSQGFPQVTATIAATAYLLPRDQGLSGGATSQGPGQAGSTATGSSTSTASTSSPASDQAAVPPTTGP